jgi:hypothetical protein
LHRAVRDRLDYGHICRIAKADGFFASFARVLAHACGTSCMFSLMVNDN